MATDTILQHWLLTQFILPFLLVFAIVFAILQKTKLLGDDKKQIDAIVALVIGLIFVGVAYPKLVVGNLIQFLAVAIIVIFVGLILWGFATGSSLKEKMFDDDKLKWTKWVFGVVLIIALIIALLWATNANIGNSLDFLFGSNWSSGFWTNLLFIVVLVVVISVAVGTSKVATKAG